MKNIFVGNLNFGATEAAVRSLFEAYGTVDRVNIITDRDTGQPRGFGFVEYDTPTAGEAAIRELNGKNIGGRPLVVREAEDRREGGGGGGGPRGGGGGRRR